jgi:tRNA pseudouridine55 synthase
VVDCSSGTYVRSLIADLGDAYCEELRRTRVGPFDVADSAPEKLIALEEALRFLPELRLGPDDARRASHGATVPGHASGVVRLTDDHGLIALAEPRGERDTVKPIVGFRG